MVHIMGRKYVVLLGEGVSTALEDHSGWSKAFEDSVNNWDEDKLLMTQRRSLQEGGELRTMGQRCGI
jgi:hypothetical protein